MKNKLIIKHDNRGVSLTELIVVVAIMAVLAGSGIAMTGMLPRMQLKTCVQDFVGQMSSVKTSAMSFENVHVELYYDNSGVYLKMVHNGTEQETVQIGEKGITCKMIFADSAVLDLVSGSGAEISYSRSSGGFEDVEVSGTSKGKCSQIIFNRGSAEVAVDFHNLTGMLTY